MSDDRVEVSISAIGNHKDGYEGEIQFQEGVSVVRDKCGHRHSETGAARDCVRRLTRKALEHYAEYGWDEAKGH